MAEQHYVFIKNNVVEQIAVFAEIDEELADRVAQEQGYDDAVWVGENIPHLFATYDAKKKEFIEPTLDYLYERGVASENSAMQAEKIAKQEAEKAATE